VLLARDETTHRELVSAFASRQVGKTYLALVWGKPRPHKGRYEWPLGPDRHDRRRMLVDPEGRKALTEYEVRGHAAYASLVELHPRTGRTHQLRVHLAHAGHPIVGDDLYGGPRHRGVRNAKLKEILQANHPYLHAWHLHLPTSSPIGELFLAAPLPADLGTTLQSLGLSPP
jgi:23S rRNA pseudouridine1911/1915/1917 synthase